ncbi:MAG: acetolactate synthase small subunit [bacterium]|nr:acetolactate synthase small subunit [bacterium]
MRDNRVLSVLVEDKPGVLARVSSLLARRGFNIHSLAVGPTADAGLSTMTIVVMSAELEQVKKQLHKLVNVVKITELDPATSIEREIMLVKINATPGRRGEVIDLARIFNATPVDVAVNSITLLMAGKPTKLNDFLDLVRPFGVMELVKSGRIGIRREPKVRKLKAVG